MPHGELTPCPLPACLPALSILKRAPRKRPGRVAFEGITVYYFPRCQGFTSVPSRGGCTLGMAPRHSACRRFSLAEFTQERARARREKLRLRLKEERLEVLRSKVGSRLSQARAVGQLLRAPAWRGRASGLGAHLLTMYLGRWARGASHAWSGSVAWIICRQSGVCKGSGLQPRLGAWRPSLSDLTKVGGAGNWGTLGLGASVWLGLGFCP